MNVGAVPGAGIVLGLYKLTSECVNGQRANATVLYGGPAIGLGIDFGVSEADVSFEDYQDRPSPWVFDGTSDSGVLSAGVVTPFGGVATGAGNLGGAYSRPVEDGSVVGLDYGIVMSVFGGSSLIDFSYESCECE